MNKTMINTLKLVAEKIVPLKVKWIVFGSSGLALNGMPIKPDDIDILTDAEGLLKINKILHNYETEPIKNAPSEIFDSLMNKFEINGYSIEVMSNFKVKSRVDNKWYLVDYLLDQPKFVDLDTIKIPVLPLSHSIELYKLMGRDKDFVKVAKIEEYLARIK